MRPRRKANAYLRLFPRDSRALLVMAEIALSRPEPEPRRALELLDRIEADSFVAGRLGPG